MTLPETSPDDRYLTAACINLFIESLRRTSGRVLLVDTDIPILFDMIAAITEHKKIHPAIDAARSRELTQEERERILHGMAGADTLDEPSEGNGRARH